ncbi:MAG: hypothetical protein AAF213_11685 [Pseudomonadota bacterium]
MRDTHGDDHALWQAFEACSNTMQDVLETGGDPRDVMRKNHELLVRIGVVPQPAQDFVSAIEQAGGAAKISGAGSVTGDKAGVLLVYLPDTQVVHRLQAENQDCRWERLRLAPQGAHLQTTDTAKPGTTRAGTKANGFTLGDSEALVTG